MVQRRGAKPNPARPTSVFELNKFVSVINIICIILGRGSWFLCKEPPATTPSHEHNEIPF